MKRYVMDHAGAYPELFGEPAIFLSASEPYIRQGIEGPEAARNLEYVARARPQLVFDAVSALCKAAFQRDVGLVFGGHPAISPMVLDIAARFRTPDRKRVVVFQSLFFEKHIPEATLQFAQWGAGSIVWTPALGNRDASLRRMRELMVGVPNLIASVFIGGMDGCEDEAAAVRDRAPGPFGALPRFAVGSTGSAAESLLERNSQSFSGIAATYDILRTNPSYPLVMKRIFEDLNRP